jgi:hypothetical protein
MGVQRSPQRNLAVRLGYQAYLQHPHAGKHILRLATHINIAINMTRKCGMHDGRGKLDTIQRMWGTVQP